jgi:hypothetical protein
MYLKDTFMFRLVVIVVCVSSVDVLLWGSSWSCIDACVLLACRYVTAFSPVLCSLYLEEVLCLICADVSKNKIHLTDL